MNEKYSVVFSGKIQDGQSEDEVKNRLASSFGMPLEKVAAIFKGRPVVIKRGLDKAVAEKYIKTFSRAGALCQVRPENPPASHAAAATAPAPPAPTQPLRAPRRATSEPSGFWRRFFAFFIDGIIIGIPGWIIGFTFFDQLVRLGQPGRLIGFAIALAYFAILNSSIGRGQTLGKKLMKIRVVDLQGDTIPLHRSALRYAIIGLPYFCNGLYIGAENMVVNTLLGLIVFGLGGAIIYFVIFNRKNRRTVHDFVAGTIVVKAEPEGAPELVPVWLGHYIAVGIIAFAMIGGLALFMPSLMQAGPFPELLSVQQTLMEEPETHTVTVQAGFNTGDQATQWFTANIVTADPEVDFEKTADHFAKVILTKHPDVAQKDLLIVNVICGYDIGIATGWRNQSYSFPPKRWQEKLNIGNI